MNWTIAKYWMNGYDVCETWHGVMCSPGAAVTLDCDAGESCGLCLRVVKAIDCPGALDLLPDCNAADLGGLCEGDGECGTSDSIDNCGVGYDVYIKSSIPVQENRVTELKLRDTNLEGTLPPELGLATYLEKLLLYDNLLSGTIPLQLASLKNVYVTNLANNRLSGTIPPSLLSSPSWVPAHCGGHQAGYTHQNKDGCPSPSLYVNGNQLSGTIPTQVSHSPSGHRRPLATSHAFRARAQIGTLRSNGQYFYCGHQGSTPERRSTDNFEYRGNPQLCPCGQCYYCGCYLPRQLANVYAQNNSLSGTLPSELGAFELDGIIVVDPPDAGWQTDAWQTQARTSVWLTNHLKQLHLGDNSLSGFIPSQLGHLTTLEQLTLRNNRISGSVPDSIRASYLNGEVANGESYGVKGISNVRSPSPSSAHAFVPRLRGSRVCADSFGSSTLRTISSRAPFRPRSLSARH